MTQQNASDRSEREIKFIEAHPEPEEWDSKFGEQAQFTLSSTDIPLGAVTNLSSDECPGLGFFYSCYEDKAVFWLSEHIGTMNAMVQAANRLELDQVYTMALDIINTHGDLNLGEICIFFARVRQGRYGHFYNTVDNTQIMKWLHEFRKERVTELARYEAALERQRKEEEEAQRRENVMTEAQYLAECRAEGRVSNLEMIRKRMAERDKKYTEEEARRLLKEDRDEEFIRKRDEMLRKVENLGD